MQKLLKKLTDVGAQSFARVLSEDLVQHIISYTLPAVHQRSIFFPIPPPFSTFSIAQVFNSLRRMEK